MDQKKQVVIERKKVSELQFAPYNPRIIDNEMFERLKKSLTMFGYVEPIVWNKRTGHVVGGNQRLKALQELGIKEVDTIVIDLPLEQEKALNLALNKIEGEWDIPKLKELLVELSESVIKEDLTITGFSIEEIERLIGRIEENISETNIEQSLEQYIIIIECEDEEHQKELLERFLAEGLKCRAQSL